MRLEVSRLHPVSARGQRLHPGRPAGPGDLAAAVPEPLLVQRRRGQVALAAVPGIAGGRGVRSTGKVLAPGARKAIFMTLYRMGGRR